MRLIRYLTFDPFLFMQDQHEMPLSLKCLQYGKMGEGLVSFYRCAWALGLKTEKKNRHIRPQTCSYVAGGNSYTQSVEHELNDA